MPEDAKTFGEQRLDEVRTIWTTLPDGVHEGSGLFNGYSVIKGPEMLLLLDHPRHWPEGIKSGAPGYGRISLVVYPRPEHLEQFESSAKKLEPGGPADVYPGAIGSITVSIWEPPTLFVKHVQSHFKIGKGEHCIPPNLAREYAGWRKLALTELVRTAHSRNLEVHFPVDLIPKPAGARFFESQLKRVARETNAEVRETASHLILRKR